MPPAAPSYELLGQPPEGPPLRLDHERFAYAGKFVMTNTGKAVARADGEIVAAVAFNRDRTDASVAWLRYVTVREDRQGEGIGPRLGLLTAQWLHDDGADRVRIAVNNPYAYVACYRAGFVYVDRETGLAEVVLERRPPGDPRAPEARTQRYRAGLDTLLETADRGEQQRQFVRDYRAAGPPSPIDAGGLELDTPDGETPTPSSPYD